MAEDDGLDAGVSSPSIAHDSAISRKNLLSSSSKRRIAELNAVQERSLSLSSTDLPRFLDAIYDTHALYNDVLSRRAAEQCLVTLIVRADSSARAPFLDRIVAQSKRSSLAPTSAIVLARWCGLTLQHVLDTPSAWTKHGKDIVCAAARLLNNAHTSGARRSTIEAGIRSIHRGLVAVFSSDLQSQSLSDTVSALTTKSTSPVPEYALVLGIVAELVGRLGLRHVVPTFDDQCNAFIIRELLGTRIILPSYMPDALQTYMRLHTDLSTVSRDLLPAMEKALLRAPEIVLDNVIPCLIRHLSPDLDLSDALATRLLKPLISNAKSLNLTMRTNALSTFRLIAVRCTDETVMVKVASELTNPLTKNQVNNAEHRAAYAQFLEAIPSSPALAQTVPDCLIPVALKETNEAAASAEITALSVHLLCRLQRLNATPASIIDAILKGLTEKRLPMRRQWTLGIADIFWRLDAQELCAPHVQPLIDAAAMKLLENWKEIQAANAAITQPEQIACACATTALCLDRLRTVPSLACADTIDELTMAAHSTALESRPAFLVAPRAYSKLVDQRELSWFLRSLVSVASYATASSTSAEVQTAWAKALIYLLVATDIPAETRRDARRSLGTLNHTSPTIARAVTAGLRSWCHDVLIEAKDCPAYFAKSGLRKLYQVVQCLCRDHVTQTSTGHASDTALDEQMLDLLTLCQPELIPCTSWIESCLATAVDPGELVKRHPRACLEQILAPSKDPQLSALPAFLTAASTAAAELAFVSPEVFLPELVRQIKEDLDANTLQTIGPTEAAIYRTAPGTMFVDVLAKQAPAQAPSKNSKDYDTLKWEAELRQQIAQKQAGTKKLSAEEHAKVKAQLEKEFAVRQSVVEAVARFQRGITFVSALVKGPPTDTDAWFGECCQSLLQVIEADVGLVLGDMGVSAYLGLADKVSPRLGSLRLFTGVATLRSLGISSMSIELTWEPLGDLVTRLLYRFRFMGEQRSLDAVTLSYVLPLIFHILRDGGIGKMGEDADEQIVLAGEFLSFHTSTCADPRLPRGRVISALIAAMQAHSQHFRLFKDSLNDLCRTIAPTLTEAEANLVVAAVIVPEPGVRTAMLQAISAELDLLFKPFYEEIWLARNDDLAENCELAREIFEENDMKPQIDALVPLQLYLDSSDIQLRRATARSLADFPCMSSDCFAKLFSQLQALYAEKAKDVSVATDKYGMPLKAQSVDPWTTRHGIALTFKELTPSFTDDAVVPFLQFMIGQGPLGDKVATVQEAMVDAAMSIVTAKGGTQVKELMTLFESTLSRPDSASAQADLVNEAVVILYGALARHLAHGDPQVPKVVQRLLSTLSTPSESVQYAVAQCLPPLVQASPEHVGGYVQQMMDDLLQGKAYAIRRGAAYGLAGIVKGRGLSALREFRIMSTLADSSTNKKEPNRREGVYLAYELLSLILGRVFEPYIIQIVPVLLAGFGDTSGDVRQACLDAAKTCFSSLSSFGVKRVLPILLDGLDDHQWRSKKGACDSLGAMAYLDPRQLAVSLPEIIPPLTEVLNDSHKEVRASANRSLQRFGDVISNPEIKSQVQILLKALSDPTKFTDDALDALIKVNFVHYLDAPSLALVVRILERGLGDRSATKRKSSQIIGSLAHLTDRKDLIAHLPVLVAGLRVAIVDAVPATRATASKALGSAVEKLGEEALPDLIPSLMSTLKSETGAGDRLGSAQALSEVLAGLGTRRLEETLPTILQNVSSSKAAVREGFMSLFIYLPATFGNSFSNYLASIIPPILAGLADEIESIRETALRAGRLLVKNFATRAIDLLLPELERGLADDSHRIRLSSVELVGELLFNLTGITGQEQDEAEDTAAKTGQSLLEILGEEKRNKVLSALYICRNDTSGLVKAAAIEVWKALVSTPRTLRELVPTLTQLLIRRLASNNPEQKEIAGNALGELIRKAGENVLATLLPTLEDGLQTSTDADARQGICIALRELIASASPEGLADYEKTLISVVRTALVDSNASVREAAAEAFDSMQKVFGKKAVDQVLPYLLTLLRSDEEAENSLSALLTLLTDVTRSNIILPNLLPTLLAPPITAFNARALASLAGVARSAMTRRLPNIFNALLDSSIGCQDPALKKELDESFESVLLSVDEYDGLNTAMSVMLGLVKHDDHRKRAATETYLATFFSKTHVDYSRYYPDLIRVLLIAFDDRDSDVVKAAWSALTVLTSHLRKEEMESLVMSTKTTLGQVGTPGHDLPGFSLSKGIGAILPIFLQGLMNGTADQRMQAALAISDIIDRTNADSLKPYVTQITGPLIRVLSERSVDVKAAILFTLNNLLEKIPLMLKPFLPQLQRTFAKSLADPTSEVLRSRAAKALGTLITLTPRVDPLIAELVTGCKTPDDGVRDAMMKALFEVVSKAGSLMSDVSRESILGLIDSDVSGGDRMVTTNARLLGVLVKVLPAETSYTLIKNRVLTTNPTYPSLLALNAILLDAPDSITKPFEDALPLTIIKGMSLTTSPIPETSILAAGKYLLLHLRNPSPTQKEASHVDTIFERLANTLDARSGSSIDSRRLTLVILRTAARHAEARSSRPQKDSLPPLIRPQHREILAPQVFACVRDPVIPIKLAAEQAFLAIFEVVTHDAALFDEYLATVTDAGVKRSLADWFRRVALRLAAQARERREAEGASNALGLANDEDEDEREVWSVGRME